jgi:hypothetical protein
MTQAGTAKLWTERLRRFEQAQMTVAQFCASEGVSQPSFYKWKRRLRTRQDEQAPAVAKFVPVTFQATPDRPVVTQMHANATIELPGGVRIRVEVPSETPPHRASQALP